MDDSLEQSLRSALRPNDPGERFTQKVLAQLPGEAAQNARAPRQAQRRAWSRWMPAALAASVLVLFAGVVAQQQVEARREAQAGARAKAELLQALRVTSEKLDLAYQAVESPSPENRS